MIQHVVPINFRHGIAHAVSKSPAQEGITATGIEAGISGPISAVAKNPSISEVIYE
jgi:hypothetical protein